MLGFFSFFSVLIVCHLTSALPSTTPLTDETVTLQQSRLPSPERLADVSIAYQPNRAQPQSPTPATPRDDVSCAVFEVKRESRRNQPANRVRSEGAPSVSASMASAPAAPKKGAVYKQTRMLDGGANANLNKSTEVRAMGTAGDGQSISVGSRVRRRELARHKGHIRGRHAAGRRRRHTAPADVVEPARYTGSAS